MWSGQGRRGLEVGGCAKAMGVVEIVERAAGKWIGQEKQQAKCPITRTDSTSTLLRDRGMQGVLFVWGSVIGSGSEKGGAVRVMGTRIPFPRSSKAGKIVSKRVCQVI